MSQSIPSITIPPSPREPLGRCKDKNCNELKNENLTSKGERNF